MQGDLSTGAERVEGAIKIVLREINNWEIKQFENFENFEKIENSENFENFKHFENSENMYFFIIL